MFKKFAILCVWLVASIPGAFAAAEELIGAAERPPMAIFEERAVAVRELTTYLVNRYTGESVALNTPTRWLFATGDNRRVAPLTIAEYIQDEEWLERINRDRKKGRTVSLTGLGIGLPMVIGGATMVIYESSRTVFNLCYENCPETNVGLMAGGAGLLAGGVATVISTQIIGGRARSRSNNPASYLTREAAEERALRYNLKLAGELGIEIPADVPKPEAPGPSVMLLPFSLGAASASLRVDF